MRDYERRKGASVLCGGSLLITIPARPRRPLPPRPPIRWWSCWGCEYGVSVSIICSHFGQMSQSGILRQIAFLAFLNPLASRENMPINCKYRSNSATKLQTRLNVSREPLMWRPLHIVGRQIEWTRARSLCRERYTPKLVHAHSAVSGTLLSWVTLSAT